MWAKIWDLLLELWGKDNEDDDGLCFAAILVGDPKLMDEATKKCIRLDYARVCVLILASEEQKEIVPVFVGRETQFRVEYEWIPA